MSKYRIIREWKDGVVRYIPQKRILFWWRNYYYEVGSIHGRYYRREEFQDYPEALKFMLIKKAKDQKQRPEREVIWEGE